MDDKQGAIVKEEFDVVSGLPTVGVDEISKPAFVIKTEPNDDELVRECVDEISQKAFPFVIKIEHNYAVLETQGGDEISQTASPFVIKIEHNYAELETEGVDEISQTASPFVIKIEPNDAELETEDGDEISQTASPFVIKTEHDDELITGVDEISQTISLAAIKAESKDNELPEVYGHMISQPPNQIVIKAEHLNDELPVVCENALCQQTPLVFLKTKPKDEEQYFALLENLVHRNNLHDEIPDSQPQVVIETKPLDELYSHNLPESVLLQGHEINGTSKHMIFESKLYSEVHNAENNLKLENSWSDISPESVGVDETHTSAEQSCEVQSGEYDVQTIPKIKNKSTLYKSSVESKGLGVQGIKPQNMSSHIGLHKQQCYKTCEICHKSLAPSYLVGHMRKHKLLPFRCTRCGKLFPNNDIFENHRKDCERKKLLVCQICQLGFSMENSLREHFKAFHNSVNKNVYSCLFCSKVFRRKISLFNHTKNHTNPGKIKIKCPVCTDTFIGMDCFQDHFETHDTAKDFVWCHFCKEHVLLSNYETHLQVQYSHKCQVCSKGFQRIELLRNHEAHCSNEEIYQCYFCLESFKTKEILNTHQSKHLGLKMLHCWICNQEVSTHAGLHRHFYTHKENLPMKCNVCSRQITCAVITG